MNVILNGLEEVQNISMNLQQEILRDLGLDERVFQKYQGELGLFMQQLMMGGAGSTEGVKDMSLEEVKYAIRLQINYIQQKGDVVADKILEATENWPPNKKQQIPMLMSIVIADGAFEDNPEIDEESVQQA